MRQQIGWGAPIFVHLLTFTAPSFPFTPLIGIGRQRGIGEVERECLAGTLESVRAWRVFGKKNKNTLAKNTSTSGVSIKVLSQLYTQVSLGTICGICTVWECLQSSGKKPDFYITLTKEVLPGSMSWVPSAWMSHLMASYITGIKVQ